MLNPIISAGQATFFSDEYIQNSAMAWAKQYFGHKFVKASVSGIDSCTVSVWDLNDNDEAKFRALYDAYDAGGQFEVDADWSEAANGKCCELPYPVSRGIIAEMLPDFEVGTVIPTARGILVLEKDIDELI